MKQALIQNSRLIYKSIPSRLKRAAQVICDGFLWPIYSRNGRRFGNRHNLFGQHAGQSLTEPNNFPHISRDQQQDFSVPARHQILSFLNTCCYH